MNNESEDMDLTLLEGKIAVLPETVLLLKESLKIKHTESPQQTSRKIPTICL